MLSKNIIISLMSLITIFALAFVTPSVKAQTFGVSLDTTGDISAESGLQLEHPGGTLVVTVRFDEAVILTANHISIAGYSSNGDLIAGVGLAGFAPTTVATDIQIGITVTAATTRVRLGIAAGIASADPFNDATSAGLTVDTELLADLPGGGPTVYEISRVGLALAITDTPEFKVSIRVSEPPTGGFTPSFVNVSGADISSVETLASIPEMPSRPATWRDGMLHGCVVTLTTRPGQNTVVIRVNSFAGLGGATYTPPSNPVEGVHVLTVRTQRAEIAQTSGVAVDIPAGKRILDFPVISTNTAWYGIQVPNDADPFGTAAQTTPETTPQTAPNTAQGTTGTTPETTPKTTPQAAGIPFSVKIVGTAERTGTIVNEKLGSPLLVQVLDLYDEGVANVRVVFQITAGKGRITNRRNGQSIARQTDAGGYARVEFTPTKEGTATVEVSVKVLDETLEFTIQTGTTPATPTTTPKTTPGTTPAATPGTGSPTPTPVSPVVHVGAAKRLPMLWVSGGKIYALVGADVERFAPSVDNALSIAVGDGKVYWTEMTGENAGTINSANLNGTGVEELKSIQAVPIGIAVDTAGSKLYWTNSRGRIQSANLKGSGIANVVQNLKTPMDIALSGGNAYWTQGDGSVRFVNLSGQKVVRNISTGSDTPGSLAIANGKVYWTEMNAAGGGTINAANLDGTGATQLASILAAPSGIAVDTARSKLYWTNSRGRVQRANLNGSGIKTVVDGLGHPGEIVIGNSIAETLAAGAPTAVGLTRNRIQEQINLQQLGTEIRPEKTQLLANYPNPFNPETWIPYELATDTNVRITIYASNGVVVRSLQLGHQSAGYYTDRERAAYWDGRNALGEQVASGIYFYQFETDEISSMRKMVILK